MDTRKIQLVGKRSYSVSLPKKWVVEHGLKEGDNVFIEHTKASDLVLKPDRVSSKDLSSLEVNLSEIEGVSEFLLFCYMKNIDNIKIKSSRFDLASIRKIKQSLKGLEGFDITKETQTSIEISFLFNDINISLERIILRMIYILKVMLESIEQNDSEALKELEETEDRLYYLAKRILFKCLGDDSKKESIVKGKDDLLFLWDIFKKLENIADRVQKLKDMAHTKSDTGLIKDLIEYIEKSWNKKQTAQKMLNQIRNTDINVQDHKKKIILDSVKKHVSDVVRNLVYFDMESKFYS